MTECSWITNEEELKSIAFDYINEHDKNASLTLEAEQTVFELTDMIISRLKGV
jgi:hypothetical protein